MTQTPDFIGLAGFSEEKAGTVEDRQRPL